jgi:hypothetical protein
VAFEEVSRLYGAALATILLLPRRYRTAGQMTQRIFEAVLAGCLPLAPADIRHVDRFVPPYLVVGNGAEVIDRIARLQDIAGSREHAELIAECLGYLDLFRLSRQADALEAVLHEITSGKAPGLRTAR